MRHSSRYLIALRATLSIVFLWPLRGPAAAQALPTPAETAEALRYYLSRDPGAIHSQLERTGLRLCSGSELPNRVVGGALFPARGFARVDAVNKASLENEWEDWNEIADVVSAFSGQSVEAQDAMSKRMETEEYCDKRFQRVRDDEQYRVCQFRYMATQMLFGADKELCLRDAEALGDAAKTDSSVYGCLRLVGWKNASDWKENIELPVKLR
ncbi:MAG: hypothetical protein ABW189_05715 [Rickettsiales bacterium]